MGITLAHLKEAVDRLLDRIALVAQTASKSIEWERQRQIR